MFNPSKELVDKVEKPDLLTPAMTRDEATATRRDNAIMIVDNSRVGVGIAGLGEGRARDEDEE
jgi:hypothetical protein